MKLTIGMATYDDADGVWMTIQSLRMNHDLSDTEIVVIDNRPGRHAHADRTKQICMITGARYIPFSNAVGTTQSRNRIFEEAKGDAVLCIDSHILIEDDAISMLKDYYDDGHDMGNLLHGPLVYDNLTQCTTHFDLFWRGEMWGIWSSAWRDNDGRLICFRTTGNNNCLKIDMMSGEVMEEMPFEWAGHEKHVEGAVQIGNDKYDVPFEIPAMGLGLFSCRKDAWLRFNPHFRGFGGEECYIHWKYRQADRQNICLPFMRWVHRFGHTNGVKYPLTRFSKVRNYILGHNELGFDLEPVRKHFVDEIGMPAKSFEQIADQPMATHEQPVVNEQPAGELRIKNPEGMEKSIDGIYEALKAHPRDLNEHFEVMTEYAGKVKSLTEFTKRRESSIAFAYGRPGIMTTYTMENDELIKAYRLLMKESYSMRWDIIGASTTSLVPEIDQTELLYIDDIRHTATDISKALAKFGHKVTRYIMFRGVGTYGHNGSGSTPERRVAGLLGGIAPYANENGYEVIYHNPNQYGMTIISKNRADWHEKPIHLWAPNYGAGVELKKMLAKIGIVATPNCSCNRRAAAMDFNGADWCEKSIENIVDRDGKVVEEGGIVGWLEEEAGKRDDLKSKMFTKTGARMMIRRAIKKARKQEKERVESIMRAKEKSE